MTRPSGLLPFATQHELLRFCSEHRLDLDAELRRNGFSHEDLRYRHNSITPDLYLPHKETGRTQTLGEISVSDAGVPAVSFFSGAGGLDLGFEAAGFQHLASIEANELFCDTLRKNRSHWAVIGPPMYSGDVRNKDELSHLLRQKLGLGAPFEGVFHGGPPCQPFSVASNQRFSKDGENFKRVGFQHVEYGNLLFDYIWFINEFRPRAFLIENVPGLLDFDGGDQLNLALSLLSDQGYTITPPTVLNAAEYGVPQVRTRLFIGGTRGSACVVMPSPNSFIVPCSKVFDLPIVDDGSHVTRNHRADSVLRYMELRYGQREHLGRVDRLSPVAPAKTVIAGGTKGGGRSHLHPTIPRTLSARECARLQTFPDDYEFCGPAARQFTQVGNAVPPLLAFRIARAIYESTFR